MAPPLDNNIRVCQFDIDKELGKCFSLVFDHFRYMSKHTSQ